MPRAAGRRGGGACPPAPAPPVEVRSCPRPPGDEEGELALLHRLVTLVDHLALFDHHAALAHAPLGQGTRATMNGVADPDGGKEAPFEAHEGENGQGRPGHAPAQSRREGEREQARHAVRVRRGRRSRETGEEPDVSAGHGHAGRFQGHVDLDVLEEALHGRRRGLAHQRRRSTACSVSPSCTTSPSWLTSSRSTVTRPQRGSGPSFLAAMRERTWMVSPILIGPLNFHLSPLRAPWAAAGSPREARPCSMLRPRSPWAIRSPKREDFMCSASVWSTL